MTPKAYRKDKKSGPCPLFRIRSCRIAGLQSCQFIRGQRRSGIVEGHHPFSIGRSADAAHANLVGAVIAIQNDRCMTWPGHFCEEKSGGTGISTSHAVKIR
jgi:hypothetical protein